MYYERKFDYHEKTDDGKGLKYFSYIMAVSFIGGGNRRTWRKPLTCRKSLTNFIT